MTDNKPIKNPPLYIAKDIYKHPLTEFLFQYESHTAPLKCYWPIIGLDGLYIYLYMLD